MNIRTYQRPLIFTLIALTTSLSMNGCAAGNFGFVRSVAKWNLKHSLLPRILFYILLVIIPVYPIALLLDLLINNTIEFWTGSAPMTAKNETFHKDGYRVDVAHTMNPLRKTVMTAYDPKGAVASVVEFRETAEEKIELYVNSEKKAEVKNTKEGLIQLLNYQGSAATRQTFQRSELEGASAEQVRKLIREKAATPVGALAAK
jgi:hypothetical protein